ncbi:MAG: hypothetical protein ACP5ON_04440 [Bacteroidota bacterium]
MMRVRLAFFFTAFVPLISFSTGGGSPYSRLGLGDLRYFAGTAAIGMANTGIAVVHPNEISALNPAAWAGIHRTRFDVGFLYEGFQTDDQQVSVFQSSGNFSGLLFAIPVAPSQGLTVAGGFLPYSTMNYNIETSVSLFSTPAISHYYGDGGISMATIGFSYDLMSDFHIGSRFNYVFGTLGFNTSLSFPQANELFGGTARKELSTYGVNFTLGAVVDSLGKLLSMRLLRSASIGFIITTPSKLNLSRVTYYTYAQKKDTSATSSSSVDLPFSLGIGIALPIAQRTLLAADFFTQPWSKSKPLSPSSPFENLHRIALGIQRSPYIEPGAAYFDRSEFRAGIFYSTLYETVNGNSLREYGLSGGIGLPLSSGTMMRISVEYARRAPEGENLINDRIIRLGIMISASERWFVRPEE